VDGDLLRRDLIVGSARLRANLHAAILSNYRYRYRSGATGIGWAVVPRQVITTPNRTKWMRF
jgi:hypothetical protein